MTEHVVNDYDPSNRAEYYLVQFEANGKATEGKFGILEFLFMVKDKEFVLFILRFSLYVVLLEAEILAIDRYEMDPVLDLHFHADYLVLYHFFLIGLVPMRER